MSHEPMTAGAVQKKSKIYGLSMTAVMAAVTCVLAPMSIPIGPVPISFTNLAIYLSLYLLGWKRGTVSYLVYVLIGMVGVPVFSGFTGGMGRLLGPTGGYIVGFIPMALIAGAVIDRFRNRGIQLAGMIAGTAVCYAFGTAWYCFQAGSSVGGRPGAVRVPLHPRRPGQNADRHGAGPHDPLPAGEGGTVSGMTSFSQPSGGEAQRTAAGPA